MRRFLLLLSLALLAVALVAVAPAAAWTWPAGGPVLLAFSFDPAHPYSAGEHRGIDIGGDPGSAVLAPAGGRRHVRGNGSGQREVADDPHRRRVVGHADAARIDRGGQGRDGRRGRRRRDDRPERRRRGERPVRAARHPPRRPGSGLRRSADAASAAVSGPGRLRRRPAARFSRPRRSPFRRAPRRSTEPRSRPIRLPLELRAAAASAAAGRQRGGSGCAAAGGADGAQPPVAADRRARARPVRPTSRPRSRRPVALAAPTVDGRAGTGCGARRAPSLPVSVHGVLPRRSRRGRRLRRADRRPRRRRTRRTAEAAMPSQRRRCPAACGIGGDRRPGSDVRRS